MTVMIQKIGSGVPQNGELKRGELGLDLDSNTIYSSSNGTDVVVMGISEIKWDSIQGIPDFILNINPEVPGYIDITDLEGRVTVNEQDIAALKGIVIPDNGDSLSDLIAKNAADIQTNLKAIETNVEAIEANVAVIQNNASGIQTNAEDIAALQAALGDAVTGLVMGGKYDAENNVVTEVTTEGTEAGLMVGQNVPISSDTKGIYVIVTVGGTLDGTTSTANASGDHKTDGQPAYPGDWLLSDGIHGWILMDFHTDATEWGTIGGTLSNQTDLMAEFAKYIKSTDEIDGGSYTAVRNS